MSLTPQQKDLYNLHLKISREHFSKPWRPRKNFDNIDPIKEEHLKKIHDIITSKNINPNYFFMAPYELWADEKNNYNLEFYTKFKALKTYNTWINKLLLEEPEHDIIINMIKDGFLHMYKKCKELKIKSIEDYFTLKEFYPTFLLDLKERFITYYNVLSINNYDQLLKNYSKEDIEFVIPDYYNMINTLRGKYYRTDKIKKLNNKIINKLNKLLN